MSDETGSYKRILPRYLLDCLPLQVNHVYDRWKVCTDFEVKFMMLVYTKQENMNMFFKKNKLIRFNS